MPYQMITNIQGDGAPVLLLLPLLVSMLILCPCRGTDKRNVPVSVPVLTREGTNETSPCPLRFFFPISLPNEGINSTGSE